MQRAAYHRRKKAKRLSPYRRLETELANARHATEAAVDEYILIRKALTDALGFLDRAQNTKDDGWCAADVLRLAEIRSLAVKL